MNEHSDGSCQKNLWAGVALGAFAAYVLVIAGVAAFVGAGTGRESAAEYRPRRSVIVPVAVGAIVVFAWIAAVTKTFGCPSPMGQSTR